MDAFYSRRSNCLLLRVFAWIVVIISIVKIFFNFSTQDKVRNTPFERQTEVKLVPGEGFIVECSSEYLHELDKYEGCASKNCKRLVLDKVISTTETDELLAVATNILNFGRPMGGKSKFDVHSGYLSNERYFVNLYKLDITKNSLTQKGLHTLLEVKEKIRYAIARHFGVQTTKLYLTYPTYFSEIRPKISVAFDEHWHPQSENKFNFHYSTILYLGDYNIDFKGGRFIFIDKKYNSTIEPRKGRLCMFSSGDNNSGHIEEVTSGARYAMGMSFTCDEQYALPDPEVNYDIIKLK